MTSQTYSVLIRTLNSAHKLPFTLECLKNQTVVPDQYVFVDSGSIDNTMALYPPGAVVHRYVGKQFNYSEAVNQGLDHVSGDYVFIASSHTVIIKRDALAFAKNLLANNATFAAAYFDDVSGIGPLDFDVIDQSNFDGENGLWNWCALVRMDLLKRRKFRPEVFSAEDQEWAKWAIFEEGLSTARIRGAGAINFNDLKNSPRKIRNAYVAVAYYSNRKLLSQGNIWKIASEALSPTSKMGLKHRYSRLLLAGRLVGCWISEPKAKSRYF